MQYSDWKTFMVTRFNNYRGEKAFNKLFKAYWSFSCMYTSDWMDFIEQNEDCHSSSIK